MVGLTLFIQIIYIVRTLSPQFLLCDRQVPKMIPFLGFSYFLLSSLNIDRKFNLHEIDSSFGPFSSLYFTKYIKVPSNAGA